jgi:hypothetical protein
MGPFTTATTLALINTFKDPLISACKELKSEVLHFLDDGLPDYIESIQDKFLYTKTFLYRQEKVNFYDTFFPVSILVNKGNKVVTSCEELFSESNFVSIVGSAGSGKTMLMKHFFLESITTAYKIPIFIELRSLNEFEKNFTDLIYEVILNNRLSPDNRILEKLLESGSFILLLDGYDEIFSQKKNVVTNDLDKFIDRYSKNRFVISSRPGSGIDSMPRFNNYPVMPLEEHEIEQFIDKVLTDNEDIELAPRIKDVIKRPENSDYQNFLSSPLLLSMFIITFKQYPELPKKKSKFYWNVFDTLATKHDSFTKKGGYQHERKAGLDNEQIEKVLQWFSYKSLFSGKVTFDAEYLSVSLSQIKRELNLNFDITLLIDDLTVALSILLIDGIEYRFPHKSLQEYFAVSLVRGLQPETKKKIYQSQFRKLAGLSTGGHENIWALALEVDRYDFNRYFLIPFLDEFLETFNGLEGSKKLKHYYSRWNMKEGFRENPLVGFTFQSSHIYNSELMFYFALLRLVEIQTFTLYNLISNAYHNNNTRFTAYLETIKDDPYNYDDWEEDLEDEGENVTVAEMYFSAKHHWDEELEQLLEESGAVKQFNALLLSIQEKINSLREECAEADSASANLLRLD